MGKQEDYNTRAVAAIADEEKTALLNKHLQQYRKSHQQGVEQFSNLELAKKRAEHLRVKVIENLDKYLLEFETNATRQGMKIVWAPNSEDALKEVEEILKNHKVKQVVKTKTSVAEEIGLKEYLSKKEITITETDVGDVALEGFNDASSHIIFPAIQKSHKEIAQQFPVKKEDGEMQSIAETVSHIASKTRKQYFNAQAAITGCNFLVANPGSVALTENEGNILFSSSQPKVHIVLATIEKIIPALTDLGVLFPLLATFGTGQNITAYNTIINGPLRGKEKDGPQEVYVVLIDNGRSEVLARNEQRKALTCIKCGACTNVSPIYKTIGGQAYGIANPGPIGAVTAQLKYGKDYNHLSNASLLSGKEADICPVNINLHDLFIENRKENRDAASKGFFDNYVWKVIKGAMLNRKKMNRGETFKNLIIKSSYKKDWGERREFPETAKKSFNQLWREQNNEK